MDVFLLPLQEQGQNPTSVAFLQEVAFVTSILSGAAKDYQKLFNRGDNVLYPTHIGKLQACMKSLIPIYWSTENWRSISLKLGEVKDTLFGHTLSFRSLISGSEG